MGAEQPKPQRKMDKIELEIVCDKVYQYLMLHRGRKIDELALKERKIKEKLKDQKRLYADCLFDVSSVVSLLNWINASKIVMRNVQFIKERSMQIVAASNERSSEKIAPLIKYIQSVIWASERLNLKQIKEFTALIHMFFGPDFIKLAKGGAGVDPVLADCFKFVEPAKPQVGDYLRNMIRRYGFDHIDLEKELPPSYRKPDAHQSTPAPGPNNPQGNNDSDQKFDYKGSQGHYGGGGFFDNPNNMAGQSNWNRYLNPSFAQNNNFHVGPNAFNGPNHQQSNADNSHVQKNFNKDQTGHSQGGNDEQQSQNFPRPGQTGSNDTKSDQDDFDKMINDLQQKSVVKDGNELVNPSMSQMNLGSKTKPNPPPKKDDFEDLINSLQGNVVRDTTNTPSNNAPAMRGPPQRRNKKSKPVINEPEAFMYTGEVDEDTEDKRYENLSLEYRIEEMRKLRV